MKKIDFEHFKLKTISGKEMIADKREVIADAIYQNTGSLKFKLLAEKIYKSSGEQEYTDEEIKLLQIISSAEVEILSNLDKDAINAAINI